MDEDDWKLFGYIGGGVLGSILILICICCLIGCCCLCIGGYTIYRTVRLLTKKINDKKKEKERKERLAEARKKAELEDNITESSSWSSDIQVEDLDNNFTERDEEEEYDGYPIISLEKVD